MRPSSLSYLTVISCLTVLVSCGSNGPTAGETTLSVTVDDPGSQVTTVIYDILCGGESFEDQLYLLDVTNSSEWEGLLTLPVGDCDALLVGVGQDGSPLCASVTGFTVTEDEINEPSLDLDCSDVGGSDGGSIAGSVVTTTTTGNVQLNECNLFVSGLEQFTTGRSPGVSVTVNVEDFCTQTSHGTDEQ